MPKKPKNGEEVLIYSNNTRRKIDPSRIQSETVMTTSEEKKGKKTKFSQEFNTNITDTNLKTGDVTKIVTTYKKKIVSKRGKIKTKETKENTLTIRDKSGNLIKEYTDKNKWRYTNKK